MICTSDYNFWLVGYCVFHNTLHCCAIPIHLTLSMSGLNINLEDIDYVFCYSFLSQIDQFLISVLAAWAVRYVENFGSLTSLIVPTLSVMFGSYRTAVLTMAANVIILWSLLTCLIKLYVFRPVNMNYFTLLEYHLES